MHTNRKLVQMNRFNKILLALLMAGLAATVFLVYTDSDSAFAFPFLAGHVLFSWLQVNWLNIVIVSVSISFSLSSTWFLPIERKKIDTEREEKIKELFSI